MKHRRKEEKSFDFQLVLPSCLHGNPFCSTGREPGLLGRLGHSCAPVTRRDHLVPEFERLPHPQPHLILPTGIMAQAAAEQSI